jgi:hypothetical protein
MSQEQPQLVLNQGVSGLPILRVIKGYQKRKGNGKAEDFWKGYLGNVTARK